MHLQYIKKCLFSGATVEQSSTHDISQHCDKGDSGQEKQIESCGDTVTDGTHCDEDNAIRQEKIERCDDTIKDGTLSRYNVKIL